MSRYEDVVRQLIEARRGQPFAAKDIAAEAGLCRQTIYKIIRSLRKMGLPIDGEASFGFVVRPGATNGGHDHG